MANNPPLFPTNNTDTPGATLRDLFATNLFPSAIGLVSKMTTDDLNSLANAVGIEQTAANRYQYDFNKMFSYKAYQLAEAMLEVREMTTQ